MGELGSVIIFNESCAFGDVCLLYFLYRAEEGLLWTALSIQLLCLCQQLQECFTGFTESFPVPQKHLTEPAVK